MEKFKLVLVVILLAISLLMLGTATKLKNARKIELSGAVSGNANFDGSGNVNIETTQANIAIITGSITLEANTQENLENSAMIQTKGQIDYPFGFNKDNCIPICFAGKFYEDKGWCSGDISGSKLISLGMLTGSVPRDIILNSENITINVFNFATSEHIFWYKIILMKIS